MVLSVGWDTVRLFLHVLAAAIWVGGQITDDYPAKTLGDRP